MYTLISSKNVGLTSVYKTFAGRSKRLNVDI